MANITEALKDELVLVAAEVVQTVIYLAHAQALSAAEEGTT
jgi:hypothetical protein